MADDRPNVLFIMSDQHSKAVAGCYGHDIVHTPNMDRLAQRGLTYDNAFCASPLCGPSRVAWITGTQPHTNGVVTHNNLRHRSGNAYRKCIDPAVPSLVDCMRRDGYDSFGAGFMHADQHVDGDDPFGELGFANYGVSPGSYGDLVGDVVQRRYNNHHIISEMWEHSYRNVEGDPFPHGEEKMFDTLVVDDCLKFIEQSDRTRPFFAYAGFRAPHPPWCAPPRFHELYDPDDIGELPNYLVHFTDRPRRVVERVNYYELWNLPEEMIRKSIAAYFGFVSYTDHCIGRLVDAIDAAGLRENTLIVYASDHGEMLYRNGICEKHTFFEDAVRIPLIFSQPGVVPEGERSEALVSNIDILPTVLAMTGTAVPEVVEGKDLEPTFHGREVQEHVFSEYYHSLDPCRMVRDKRFKYIHTEEDVCELYDLDNDPLESVNLAWYPQYATRIRQMDELVMADWEIPGLPVWAVWNDLNERKQRLRLTDPDIIDPRPESPAWIANHTESGD
ncbi:MAG: sulfatase-like hydrolase/transferase [Candidatus Latescibacterota bacterium]|nr:sulfatase-like hydrolase/transferase [Candidatus Latescibacterota bacterium]